MKIKVEMTIEVPPVPEFLIDSDGHQVPLSAVTEEGLQAIGNEWTKNLKAQSIEQSNKGH